MRRRSRSIAGALYLRITALVAAAALAMAGVALVVANRAVDRSSDAQLVAAANVLLALMEEEFAERLEGEPVSSLGIGDDLLSDEDARAFHASADWRMFAVFRGGRPLIRSNTAPPLALVPRGEGFHSFQAGAVTWRAYGLAVPRQRLLLVVGERVHARHFLLRDILARLVAPLIVLLLVTAFLLRLSLRSGLASLRALSDDLSHRSSQDLARLDPGHWPRDLGMLVAALNRLFARLEDALGREQGFTDDAAHQLRTPLAAIKVQAQTVASALPPADRAMGQDLLAGVDRASALVDQMLRLARLEATAVTPIAFDARDAAAELVAHHAALAAAREVGFDFRAERPAPVTSDPAVLAVALAAICENAIRHSPPGGTITVAVAPRSSGASIAVIDQGPGVPAADRDRLFERFAQGSGSPGGAGLGLTISRRALGLLDGTVIFADGADGTGLTVEVSFPSLTHG